MKIIENLEDLVDLPVKLVRFILCTNLWINDGWEPVNTGYVFVFEDIDCQEMKFICTVPHVEKSEVQHREAMTIDFEIFDLWECPALYDEDAGYWNVVAILGEEYGCSLFLSSEFVESIHALHLKLQAIRKQVVTTDR